MQRAIVVPTYNERNVVPAFLENALPYCRETGADLFFVDDNSPDGTGQYLDQMAAKHPQVKVLHRSEKKGLGRAYIAGFQEVLGRSYDEILQMDCDLSHPPSKIPEMFSLLAEKDFVVGSRYVDGGGVERWPLHRKILSRGGSWYARTVLGVPIRDFTGGFNSWRASLLQELLARLPQSDGYAFQVELKFRAARMGRSWAEIPIHFCEREHGHSKMSLSIVLEAITRIPAWRLRK